MSNGKNCKLFRMGYCRKGDSCTFSHVLERNPITSESIRAQGLCPNYHGIVSIVKTIQDGCHKGMI